MTSNTTQRAENAPIQAHHIIPVDVLKEYGEAIQKLFGLNKPTDFQQFGGNFLLLADNQADADVYRDLIKEHKGLFGDVAIGGSKHSGDHNGYNEVVKI